MHSIQDNYNLLVEINFEIGLRVNNTQTNHCLFTLQQNASSLYIECQAKLTVQVYFFCFQNGETRCINKRQSFSFFSLCNAHTHTQVPLTHNAFSLDQPFVDQLFMIDTGDWLIDKRISFFSVFLHNIFPFHI